MSNSFDPYHRWLGIPPKHQPADHYRLLAIERFEDDVEVIRDAAEARIRHVRSYELGPHSKRAQKILNELGRAKASLLDARKRSAYDETLRHDATSTAAGPEDATASSQTSDEDSIADVIEMESGSVLAPAVPARPRAAAPRPSEPPARSSPPPRPTVDAESGSQFAVDTTAQPATVPTAQRPKRRRPLPAHLGYYVSGGMAALLVFVVIGFAFRGPGEEASLDGTGIATEKADPPRSPMFADIGPQTVDEGDRLKVVLQLQDAGAGNGPLRYRLIGGYPTGVSLDDETGTLQWTPTEEEGPGEYAVVVQVSRDTAFRLADTKTVSIEVVEVNRPPPLAVSPFDAQQALFHQKVWSKHLNLPVEITNSIGMKFRLIPPGEFQMGSPAGEKDRQSNETQHRVRVTRPFHLATTEVTQSQYERVMGTTPWKGKGGKEGRDYAATHVSWDDAVEYCRRLADLAADRGKGTTYRLATEAEWEYACRAGTATAYSFGDSATQLKDHAWFDDNAHSVDQRYAHEVGKKRPNGFGLYDMHGNVWEWCSDWYDSEYYTASPLADPQGPDGGTRRVHRGGDWNDDARYCRSAYRIWLTRGSAGRRPGFGLRPARRINDLGFRVAQVRQ